MNNRTGNERGILSSLKIRKKEKITTKVDIATLLKIDMIS
jgi:hypothetical protein